MLYYYTYLIHIYLYWLKAAYTAAFTSIVVILFTVAKMKSV